MSNLLHNFLTDSSRKYPEKVAISYKEENISYHDLELLSNQLSASLSNKGVRLGGRVGIYIDKSIESVIAIFSILKTGACYVPLDPLAPVERQAVIINDCSLKYLITSSKKLSQIKQILEHTSILKYVFLIDIPRQEWKERVSGIKIIFKDEIFLLHNSVSEQPRKKQIDSNLAYILYTSGSTGQPKGVTISHKAAIAFMNWAYKTFHVQSNDIVSSHAPLHFDLSIFDIFVSIQTGATICIVPQGLSSFPKSLVEFIANRKISTWYSVPSILTQLVLYGGLEERNLSHLRQILFAGEVFPTKYLRKLMELIPHARYYNLYGPTETNVITYFHVSKPLKGEKPIPVGIPCDGVRVFIVNESGVAVNEGEIGELYVDCPTIMDGYWNDPKKSESVLFRNVFIPSAEETVYKTGDLVSLNKDGNLEYHGRYDAMIKSRGYRIELGEVESAILAHPGIKEVAVIAVPDDKIGNRISAVIVTKTGEEISPKDIISFCSKKLPHYMIPESISFVDSIPRTSTGKIDRKKIEKERAR